MKIKASTGDHEIASAYIAEMDDGKLVEFVESVQPPIPRAEKWVLIISTLYGCPVKCRFCDAGGFYQGKLTADEMLAQIDYMIRNRFPSGKVPVEKFKIQFARMGEPALNPAVLEVLEALPNIYDAPGLLPTISTIAPEGTGNFFNRLLRIKNNMYKENFQLQFSIHTTDLQKRDWLIPVKKWGFEQIAKYGNAFYKKGERKITLNFALSPDKLIDSQILLSFFSPEKFLIKITPVNPTFQAVKHDITSHITPDKQEYNVINRLREAGYEVLLSIGEWEENLIGSNCGQYITNYLRGKKHVANSYSYPVHRI